MSHEATRYAADRAVARGHPFGVVLVELTSVVDPNRKTGYAAGGEQVRAAACVVQRAAARRGDTACRFGGCRLGLILTNRDEEAARALTEEVWADLGDERPARVATTAWLPGDDGEVVIVRARLGP